jgi:hypothetical protein
MPKLLSNGVDGVALKMSLNVGNRSGLVRQQTAKPRAVHSTNTLRTYLRIIILLRIFLTLLVLGQVSGHLALNYLKQYLCSTMGEARLNSPAIILGPGAVFHSGIRPGGWAPRAKRWAPRGNLTKKNFLGRCPRPHTADRPAVGEEKN